MQRVAVVGPGGAGKSTFAAALAARTGLPVVHLDERYFHPGWVPTPRPEWGRWQEERFAAPRWIADGAYDHTLDLRLARADTVILVAPPAWRCISSALWRSVRKRGQAVQAPGCPERILLFDREFFPWVRRFPSDMRNLRGIISRHAGHLTVVELHSRAECARFLDRLPVGAHL